MLIGDRKLSVGMCSWDESKGLCRAGTSMVLKFIDLQCIGQHTITGYSINFIESLEQVLAQVNYMKSNGSSSVNCTCTEFKHARVVSQNTDKK